MSADSTNAALKWTIVGFRNAALVSDARGEGFSAISVITTNCNPISAPAAAPPIT